MLAEKHDQIAALLAPVFATHHYEITEEGAHDLLMKAEGLVPTRRLEVVDKTAELGEAPVSGEQPGV